MNYAALARSLLERPEVRSLCVKIPFSREDGTSGVYRCLVVRDSESQGTDLTSTQVSGRYVQLMLLWKDGEAPPAYDNITYKGRVHQIQEVKGCVVGEKTVAWNVLATMD